MMFRRMLALFAAAWLSAAPAAADSDLRVAVTTLPPEKGNPHSEQIDYLGTWSALFDPLTLTDDRGHLIPWLAESWRQENPTQWLFKLRPGVIFANGEPLDADAVVAAVAYLAGQGRTEPIARPLSPLIGAEEIGPLEVRLITDGPRPVLPFDVQLLRIPAPRAWRELGPKEFGDAPIGTGPYTVESWATDRVRLVANSTSWRAPRSPRLEILAVRDPTARLAAFVSGRVDIANSVDPDSIETIEAAGGRIRRGAIPAAMAIMFNTVKDPRLRDTRVRRALNLAVDKQAITQSLFAGLTEPASQPAPKIALGYNPDIEPFPHDPDQARRLLADAGYSSGFSFVMETSNESGLALAVYQRVADDLARVGVTMAIRTMPRPQFLERLYQADWEGSAFPAGYFNAALDALSIMMRGNSCLWPNGWHCDPAIMPTIKQAMAETSLDRRTALTREIMAYSHDTAIGLFLYENLILTAVGRKVAGYESRGPFILYENVQVTR